MMKYYFNIIEDESGSLRVKYKLPELENRDEKKYEIIDLGNDTEQAAEKMANLISSSNVKKMELTTNIWSNELNGYSKIKDSRIQKIHTLLKNSSLNVKILLFGYIS